MKIDRVRFLALTAALAAACATPQPATPVVDAPPETAAPTASASTVSTLPPSTPTDAPPPAAPAPIARTPDECDREDVGSLAVCDEMKIAPTCEDAHYRPIGCRQLESEFRPAVAERIATCELKAAKGKRCPRYADDAQCRRKAVEEVCVREDARAKCAEMIANCKRRTQRVKYTLDQCARMLSAAAPSHVDELVYTLGGIDSQGAPWREGCWID